METENPFRPFPISKEMLDTINSVCWFLADAFWMIDLLPVGFALMIPTVITGLCLLYVEKRKPILLINLAINCWIFMNSLWMISDADLQGPYLTAAKLCFVMGLLFIMGSVWLSKSWKDTFSHFKRFRSLKF